MGQNDNHSSISSCDISSSDFNDQQADDLMNANMDMCRLLYKGEKNKGYPLLREAVPGRGSNYFKIPQSFLQIGEL